MLRLSTMFSPSLNNFCRHHVHIDVSVEKLRLRPRVRPRNCLPNLSSEYSPWTREYSSLKVNAMQLASLSCHEGGTFSCNMWEGTRVTCDVALQAGNQFHLFSKFENEAQFYRF